MELTDVDALQTQALQAAFQRFGEVLGARVVRPLIRAGTFPYTLGGNHQIRGIGIGSSAMSSSEAAGP